MTTFERLEDDARMVIVGSERHARALHHPEVRGVHILLAMLDDPSSACAQELNALGITAENLIEYSERVNPSGSRETDLPRILAHSSVFKQMTDRAFLNTTEPDQPHHTDVLGLLRALVQVADDETTALFAHFDVDRGTIEGVVERRRQRDRAA